MDYLRKCLRIYIWNVLRWINRRVLKTYPAIEDCARCNDCGRNVHDYHVPDDVWLQVIGTPLGVWCYDCFCDRAEKKGIYFRFCGGAQGRGVAVASLAWDQVVVGSTPISPMI